MSDTIALSRSYPSCYGVPVIRAVERDIFVRRYFTHCLACTFCHDACCRDGVDVDAVHYGRIIAHAEAIEAFVGVPRHRWFEPEVEVDGEVPGGRTYRTRTERGACVFLNRTGRGCLLHAFCLARGLDVHDFKSLVDVLFPISFCDGVLCVADDVADDSLVCLDQGPTLYRGLRHELAHYFGNRLVQELDVLEAGAPVEA